MEIVALIGFRTRERVQIERKLSQWHSRLRRCLQNEQCNKFINKPGRCRLQAAIRLVGGIGGSPSSKFQSRIQLSKQYDVITNTAAAFAVGGTILVTHLPMFVAILRHSALRSRKEHVMTSAMMLAELVLGFNLFYISIYRFVYIFEQTDLIKMPAFECFSGTHFLGNCAFLFGSPLTGAMLIAVTFERIVAVVFPIVNLSPFIFGSNCRSTTKCAPFTCCLSSCPSICTRLAVRLRCCASAMCAPITSI